MVLRGGIEVAVVLPGEAEAARHLHHVAHADGAARVAGPPPRGHRRRIVEAERPALDLEADERGREALPHRPALELRVFRDAGHVALADDLPLVDDDHGGREPFGVGEGQVDGRLHAGAIEASGNGGP